MHPAYSVIVFTTASGAGYGLLFWLAVGALFGIVPVGTLMAPVALTVALALITVGLLSSALHLGHPERAHGAFSQWRSSWLSREGVAAVATYVPAGLLWLIWVTGFGGGASALVAVLEILAAIGALATVYCTGMIYASLRTIPEWNKPSVPVIYFALASATGALLLSAAVALFAGTLPLWPGIVALASLVAAAFLKWRYWHEIDTTPAPYTVEQATGLGHIGKVRVLDPPHTRPNFVMREMGYAVARKHAHKLRRWVMLALFAAPALLILVALVVPWPLLPALLAVLLAAAGVATERWLFFAEARHISMLYYQP